jgi:hypothetical protein
MADLIISIAIIVLGAKQGMSLFFSIYHDLAIVITFPWAPSSCWSSRKMLSIWRWCARGMGALSVAAGSRKQRSVATPCTSATWRRWMAYETVVRSPGCVVQADEGHHLEL